MTLTIADGSGNTLAQTTTCIQLVDIKQMYERWTIGDKPSVAPLTHALLAENDITLPFQYGLSADTNTSYILFVHGWNVETWEKDRFAEAAFKRLHWQGYQGRFGAFRWPTGNKFSGVISAATDADNYDNSESNSWASATGLLNLLTNLDSEYQAGNVYVIAHSMGNVVTGEALRKAETPVVNTYIAMMAAIQSHAYDGAATNRSLGIWNSHTPDNYAHYWRTNDPPYFDSSAGAGTYVNFYNTNDYALGMWNIDQNLKPDLWMNYGYDGTNYFQGNSFPNVARLLLLPADTYEIFAYCDQAPCYALGATPNVGGRFTTSAQQNLFSLWPADVHPQPNGPYSAHVWHSAQFRSDYMSQNAYWHQIMRTLQLLAPL